MRTTDDTDNCDEPAGSRREGRVIAFRTPESDAGLIRYDSMCHAIQAAYEVDEVKGIRDKALAIEVSRQAKNTEAERQACEIRLRAECRVGQLLRKMDKQHGARGVGSQPATPPPQQSLADLGISKTQSCRWQQLADVTDEDFDQAVTTEGATTVRPRTRTLDSVDPSALWLWGRFLDFERQGLLAMDPNKLLTTMLPHMKTTTLQIVPLFRDWLARFPE